MGLSLPVHVAKTNLSEPPFSYLQNERGMKRAGKTAEMSPSLQIKMMSQIALVEARSRLAPDGPLRLQVISELRTIKAQNT